MQQTSQGANGAAAVDDATHVTHTSTVSTMDVFPTQSADTRATRGTRSQAPLPAAQPPSNPTPALNDADGPQEDPNATATPVATTDEAAAAAPFSAKARSLFVQLSDGFLGPEAAKAALERQATPIVPRSAGPPPHMPLNVGAGPHRTRSSSGAPKAQKPSAQSLTSPLPAYRQQIGHAVRPFQPPPAAPPLALHTRSCTDIEHDSCCLLLVPVWIILPFCFLQLEHALTACISSPSGTA